MRKLLVAFLCAAAAHAATAGYPDKPIRLIVHFPAGSTTDTLGRVLGEHVAATLKQAVIVENKPGADGAIAAAEVKRSPADGYTLLLATNSAMSGVPALKRQAPYDPLKDFTPVTDVGRYTFLVYVHPGVPAKTLPELISLARARPAKLTYGAGNVTGQLSFASVALAGWIDMTHVPYKGEPPAITDLIGGQLDVVVATAGTGVPHVRSGRLRALATIGEKRSPSLPDVPTVGEAGVRGAAIEPWAGLFGPANLPKDVVETLNEAFAAAMKDPQVIRKMAAQDFVFTPSTPEALGALAKRQLDAHREIVRAAGIQPE